VLDTGLIRNRNLSFALISFFIIMMLHAGNNFLFPLYLMQHKHIDPFDAGLILMASAIFPLIAAPSAGRFADRYGCRPICLAATLLIIALSLAFCMLSASADVLPMVISFCLFRGAIASFLGPSRKLILGHCPMESKGSGSGLMMMLSYSGLALGVAFFEIVFIEAVISGGLVRDGTPILPRLTPSLSLLGYGVTFLFEAAAAALALILVYLAQDPIARMPAQQRTLRGMAP
jgi:MFS family permease